MSVLAVVDDDDDIRKLMVLRLSAAGYDVLEASDGAAGLELVRRCQPDLLVLDWMMPGMSGIEVCREVRADSTLAHTPILMVTSRATDADRLVGLAAGATSILTKPFATSALLDAVRSSAQPESSSAAESF